jgi:predicted site-specific integrase-resolvase
MNDKQKIMQIEINNIIDRLQNGLIQPITAKQLIYESANKAFSLHAVSQQRELLIAYEKFASKEMYNDLEQQINKIIDNFLAINCG